MEARLREAKQEADTLRGVREDLEASERRNAQIASSAKADVQAVFEENEALKSEVMDLRSRGDALKEQLAASVAQALQLAAGRGSYMQCEIGP